LCDGMNTDRPGRQTRRSMLAGQQCDNLERDLPHATRLPAPGTQFSASCRQDPARTQLGRLSGPARQLASSLRRASLLSLSSLGTLPGLHRISSHSRASERSSACSSVQLGRSSARSSIMSASSRTQSDVVAREGPAAVITVTKHAYADLSGDERDLLFKLTQKVGTCQAAELAVAAPATAEQSVASLREPSEGGKQSKAGSHGSWRCRKKKDGCSQPSATTPSIAAPASFCNRRSSEGNGRSSADRFTRLTVSDRISKWKESLREDEPESAQSTPTVKRHPGPQPRRGSGGIKGLFNRSGEKKPLPPGLSRHLSA